MIFLCFSWLYGGQRFAWNAEIVGRFLLQIRKKIKTPFLVLIAGNMLQNNETNHKHKGGDVPNKITRCIASMHGDPDTNPWAFMRMLHGLWNIWGDLYQSNMWRICKKSWNTVWCARLHGLWMKRFLWEKRRKRRCRNMVVYNRFYQCMFRTPNNERF